MAQPRKGSATSNPVGSPTVKLNEYDRFERLAKTVVGVSKKDVPAKGTGRKPRA